MIARPEKSPLYNPDVSRAERRAIQECNFTVIQNGIARYVFQPGRKQVFLEGLNLNGILTDEATLNVYYQQNFSLLTYIEHPDHKGMLCRREVKASRDSMIDWSQCENEFWMIDVSKLTTDPGFEGNGLGKALLFASESLMPMWVNDLEVPPTRVIARHFDNARGAEEQVDYVGGYRTGWTSNMLKELGYRQANKSSLEYDFGEERVASFGTPEKNWVKYLR